MSLSHKFYTIMWRRLLTFVVKVSKEIACPLMELKYEKCSEEISGYFETTILYSSASIKIH